MHTGPLPAPWTLAEYDKLDPGRAKKIFDLAEDQARHRMRQEDRVVGNGITRSWTGLFLFGVVSFACFGLSWQMMNRGDSVAAAWLMAAIVTSDAAVFGYVGWLNKGEREAKRKALADKLPPPP